MVGVTASVLIGVMDPLLARLSAILEREHAKIKCVHRQIVFLRDELSSMSAALATVSESEEENPQVKEWMSQLRDLSYDVEDCIEIFIMHCLGNVDTSDGFIHKIINKVTTLKAHYHIGNQIDELKERALEVNGRRKRYKLDPSASSQRSPVIDPRLPALFEETHRLVGIDTQMDKLVMWLVDGIDSHPQRKVVSIAGLGGLGKTTLANQVFHKIRSQFDCTAFVSVTRSPNVSKVLSDTLVQFLKSSSSPNFAPQHNTSPNNRHSTANFLPHYLKICFLHLSIFPEDHVIGRLCLIRRWIAEGLIAEQRGQHLEDTALRSLQIFTAEYPEETLIISPGGFQHLEDFHFRPSMYCRKKKSMLSLVFEAGAMPRLKRLWYRFSVHDTLSAYGVNFDFGISLLLSLERLWVSINCHGARVWEVETAKVIIKNAAALLPNRPRHEIHIFGDEEMVKDEERR